jgi:hypothetical protein
MDLLTFTIEITKATAWPNAATVVAFMFRTELRVLLGKMKKGRVGPAEFEFEQTVAVLRGELARSDGLPTSEIEESQLLLAKTEPRTAILNAWLEV